MRLHPVFALALLLPLALGPARVEAGTVQRLEIEELVGQCEVAIEGRVLRVRALEVERKRIETEITFSVARRFWGEAGSELVVRLPGGVLPDGRGLVLPGMPRMVEGEELLLFLSAESSRGTRVPVGLAQGRFRIERRAQGLKTLVRDQNELELYDPRTHRATPAEPLARFDYATVVARIEAAAAQRKNRAARGTGR
jgi:hypothetical protein